MKKILLTLLAVMVTVALNAERVSKQDALMKAQRFMPDRVFVASYDWDIPSPATLYVPIGTKSIYESFLGWTMFANIVEGEPFTSIGKAVNSKLAEEGWYNLQGQKVEKPKRGIYIRNGQKILIP